MNLSASFNEIIEHAYRSYCKTLLLTSKFKFGKRVNLLFVRTLIAIACLNYNI